MRLSTGYLFAAITIGSLLQFSGCGLFEEFCPTELTGKESSYFPHEEGQAWEYAYQEEGTSYEFESSTSSSGDLTWRVSSSVDHCTYEDLVITESFDGVYVRSGGYGLDTTYAVSWEKELHARLEGNLLWIDGYVDASQQRPALQWIHRSDAPELLSEQIVSGGLGGRSTRVRYFIRRNVGITFWEYETSQRGSYNRESIVLKTPPGISIAAQD